MLDAEEGSEEFGDAGGLFVMEPMGAVREADELGVGAIAKTVLGHCGEEEGVANSPENARGDAHGGIGELGTMAECGAIPVDHASESGGLRPSRAILREVLLGKRSGATGTDQRVHA